MSTRTILGGPLDALAAVGGDVAALRALSPLPRDAQELFDKAVVKVGLERLTVAQDLLAAGLTFPVENPMSVMEIYWETQSKAGTAIRSMLPGTRDENQRVARSANRIPIYATLDQFQFHARVLAASRRVGAPLDTTGIEEATRRVNESIEDAVINGATDIQAAGNTVPGLLNAPNVNSYTFKDSELWTAAGHSGEDILEDVLGMIESLQEDNLRYGPYWMYVPTAVGIKLAQDYKSATSGTILERLQSIDTGGGNRLRIKVADRLPAGKVVMFEATSGVVQLVTGMEPTLVTWGDGPGWHSNFAVLSFTVPRVRDDFDGNSGIVVGYSS